MDDRLKLEYVHREIVKGLQAIYKEQLNIAATGLRHEGKDLRIARNDRRIRIRTGTLIRSLDMPKYRAWQGSLGNYAIFEYPTYIRFLDMKHMGNHKIYNRQIWGILYSEIIPGIRFGFTREVFDRIDNELRQAMAQLGATRTGN